MKEKEAAEAKSEEAKPEEEDKAKKEEETKQTSDKTTVGGVSLEELLQRLPNCVSR